MAKVIDEQAISNEVTGRQYNVEIHADWMTPSGRPRSAPMYQTTIGNKYLSQIKTIKAKSAEEVEQKARAQITKWVEQEIKGRIADAKDEAKGNAEDATVQASDYIDSLRNILNYTLSVDDRINWDELIDRSELPPFFFIDPPNRLPPVLKQEYPPKPFFLAIMPGALRKWREKCQAIDQQYENVLAAIEDKYAADIKEWEDAKSKAQEEYQARKAEFAKQQSESNQKTIDFRKRFEDGEPEAIIEYVKAVFERSSYPEGIMLDYEVAYEPSSTTVVVDVTLPPQGMIPDVIEYRFVTSSKELKPIKMKKKDHDELYDDVVKQIIIRTIHEVFEAVYTSHVQSVVANGWVTYINKATGLDETSCIISVSSESKQFETFNLARIDTSECIKALKGLTAGPLSNVAPVKPILQLNREDKRFIESREVLADINATTNLAEIPWEDFEHLVRDLFEKMFSNDGAEVRVTQASRDQGVDAIAFDPDPIRGGKFVIQAKRYNNVVGVSAVRDLYGTMINEGAVKGILVTTSHYGSDSRAFAKDKPITLIDGSNLVYLLEQYGHKVRIDIKSKDK